MLASSDAASLDWRRDFIRSYLERDVPMFAPRLPAETIGRLWTMLAHAQGTPLNQHDWRRRITLAGVGAGTTMDHIQVHNSSDDGIEWFGGTVNARYLVMTGNDDDSFDGCRA